MPRKKQSATLTKAKRYVRSLNRNDFDVFWTWLWDKYVGNDRPLDIRWTLAHDDDLISVLRGHLLIETRLGELLAKRFPQSGEVLEELGFAEKCRLDGVKVLSTAT